ncbi:MAG: UPF0175 family protein [Anaerolineales bacterium]|nr:UPF0175 family protein [Anaerolineales bacterium]
MSDTTFEVHLPSNLLQLGLSKDDIQQRVSEWVALSLFTEGRISSGKAARLLNINRIDFLTLLRRRGVAYINYSPEELSEEIDSVSRIKI